MTVKNVRRSIVKDPGDDIGVYLWQMPDGSCIADEDRNFLAVRSEYGSVIQQAKLRAAVRHYGITEGNPVFFPGHHPVSDEEYAEQKARLEEGLIPDRNDIGALVDEGNARETRRNE